MERIVLRPTRRFMLAQRVNHIVPAVTLLLAAVERGFAAYLGAPARDSAEENPPAEGTAAHPPEVA